jgi:hypothetical protein
MDARVRVLRLSGQVIINLSALLSIYLILRERDCVASDVLAVYTPVSVPPRPAPEPASQRVRRPVTPWVARG